VHAFEAVQSSFRMQSDDAAQKEGQGMHRVKLYKLNNQGLWDDKGTGHVGLEFLPVRVSYVRVLSKLHARTSLHDTCVLRN
jgi:hypothetical protein